MRQISIGEAASSLSRLLGQVAQGESLELVDEGRVVAVLCPPWGRGVMAAAEEPVGYGSAGAATDTAITRLLGTRSARDVLAVFMLDPAARIHQREIARRASVGLRSAQIALQRLESAGLLTSSRDGNRRYYQANRTARFEELRRVLSKEFGLVRILRQALAPVAGQVERAFIFGSTASGEDRVDSDVDLLIVGSVKGDTLAPILASVERQIGRDIDLLLYRPKQFRDKLEHERHFVTSVMGAPRIDVIGGPDDA